MSKVLYSATVSLDGYIAGPGGDMSWLRPHLQPNPPVEQLQREIGALLVGGRTHRGDDPHRGTEREGAFEGTWRGPVFIVTRQSLVDDEDVQFVRDPREGLQAARAAAGDRYVNVLGAELARQCLNLGEVDEVQTIIAGRHREPLTVLERWPCSGGSPALEELPPQQPGFAAPPTPGAVDVRIVATSALRIRAIGSGSTAAPDSPTSLACCPPTRWAARRLSDRDESHRGRERRYSSAQLDALEEAVRAALALADRLRLERAVRSRGASSSIAPASVSSRLPVAPLRLLPGPSPAGSPCS